MVGRSCWNSPLRAGRPYFDLNLRVVGAIMVNVEDLYPDLDWSASWHGEASDVRCLVPERCTIEHPLADARARHAMGARILTGAEREQIGLSDACTRKPIERAIRHCWCCGEPMQRTNKNQHYLPGHKHLVDGETQRRQRMVREQARRAATLATWQASGPHPCGCGCGGELPPPHRRDEELGIRYLRGHARRVATCRLPSQLPSQLMLTLS